MSRKNDLGKNKKQHEMEVGYSNIHINIDNEILMENVMKQCAREKERRDKQVTKRQRRQEKLEKEKKKEKKKSMGKVSKVSRKVMRRKSLKEGNTSKKEKMQVEEEPSSSDKDEEMKTTMDISTKAE